MENMIRHLDLVMGAANSLRKVGEELGAAAMLSVIGAAIDEFATREDIGQEGAKEMLERLMTIQGEVWKVEGNFYGGGK